MSIIDLGLARYVRNNNPLDAFLIGQHHGMCVRLTVTDVAASKYFGAAFDDTALADSLATFLGLADTAIEIERNSAATHFAISALTVEAAADITASLCAYLKQRFPDGFDASIY